jgi:hypothetical protein
MASKIQVDKISRNSGTPEFTVPTADGTAGQFLKTDGSGVLSFDTVTTNPLTLTGSTNNTIPTVTGANALAGEANLTYDGNVLDIKNAGTASSINLYCESSNAHYTKIKSGPHASATSYTITLPNAPPTANGQALTATTAGVASWGGAGITHASQWRLTTDVASGGQDPINANLEVADQNGYGSLGSAMTESSGVFTFPSTGFWLVIYNWTFSPSNYSNDCSCWIDATIDNASNWVEQARTYESGAAAYENPKRSASATAIIDVTSTTNVKVQFGWSININGGTRTTYGDSTKQETGFTFVRLGDT